MTEQEKIQQLKERVKEAMHRLPPECFTAVVNDLEAKGYKIRSAVAQGEAGRK